MKSQRPLSKFLTFLFVLTFSAQLWAGNAWDVAVVFLGKNAPSDEQSFQQDIDQNILELARLKNLSDIRLSIYRELPDRTFTYSPRGNQTIDLQKLLGELQVGNIKVNGKWQKSERSVLSRFLKNAYTTPQAKKLLVLYGHGQGASGMDEMALSEVKSVLQAAGVQLDILWFDSCFMANMEFLFELRSFSVFTIASQEAEFSAGLPFQTLDYLSDISDARTGALFLAKSYIESYSSMARGSQRQHVSTSAATISIVENARFERVITGLQEVANQLHHLKEAERTQIKKAIARSSMEKKSLTDLGQLLIELRRQKREPKLDSLLTTLIRELNIESVKKLKTNPRIRLQAPVENARLVFGFNNWKNGHETEYTNSVFADLLPADEFVAGPAQKNWPVASDNNLLITPFLPGVHSFHYYWIDSQTGKMLSAKKEIVRTRDIVEVQSADRLIVYSGYTQAIGASAEKYTGLNISSPFEAPSMDTFETEFNQLTGWLKL